MKTNVMCVAFLMIFFLSKSDKSVLFVAISRADIDDRLLMLSALPRLERIYRTIIDEKLNVEVDVIRVSNVDRSYPILRQIDRHGETSADKHIILDFATNRAVQKILRQVSADAGIPYCEPFFLTFIISGMHGRILIKFTTNTHHQVYMALIILDYKNVYYVIIALPPPANRPPQTYSAQVVRAWLYRCVVMCVVWVRLRVLFPRFLSPECMDVF